MSGDELHIWRAPTRSAVILPDRLRDQVEHEAASLRYVPVQQRGECCLEIALRLLQVPQGGLYARAQGELRVVAAQGMASAEAWLARLLDASERRALSGVVRKGELAAFLAPAASGPPPLRPAPPSLALTVKLSNLLNEQTLMLLQLIGLELLPALHMGKQHFLTHLQPREAELLAYLASGCRADDIAAQLGVRVQTIRTRTKFLYRRLGVRSRAELLRIRAVRQTFCAPWTHLPDEPWERLTPRHREILRGLLRGLNEKEVAQGLGLSPHTVHEHVRLIHQQLRVRNRSQLLSALVWRELG